MAADEAAAAIAPTTSSAPTVLWVGIDPHRLPGPWNADEVTAAIRSGEARFPEGVLQTWLLGQDDDLDVVLAEKLHELDWECVVVGVGVRVGAVPLEVFERTRGSPSAPSTVTSPPGWTC